MCVTILKSLLYTQETMKATKPFSGQCSHIHPELGSMAFGSHWLNIQNAEKLPKIHLQFSPIFKAENNRI